MEKWEVYRENHIEAIKGAEEWSTQDMLDFESSRTATYHELIGSFDTKEEAVALFEEEKKTCRSHYQDSLSHELVLFDYLSLEQTEYDEDGELVQNLDVLDEYVAEIS